MNSFQKKIILLGGVFVCILILLIYLFLPKPSPPQKTSNFLPTPTTFQPPQTFSSKLSTKELNYKDLPPQPLPSINSDTGILVVSSDLSDVVIELDPTENEGPQGSSQKRFTITTPFKSLSIPVGKHYLTAAKPGCVPSEVDFEIKKEDVTRLNIKLDALPAGGTQYKCIPLTPAP